MAHSIGESHTLWQIQVAKCCSGEDKAHNGFYTLRQVSLLLRRGSEVTLNIIGRVRYISFGIAQKWL